MKVLLSIKPEFAEKIFAGTKKFEYRKAIYRNPTVKTIILYVTRPVAMIVGEFDVSDVLEGSPEEVWERTSDKSGISADFFNEYFEGRSCAFAFQIGEVRKYQEPVLPADMFEKFTAPQSYMYVDRPTEKSLHAHADQLALI